MRAAACAILFVAACDGEPTRVADLGPVDAEASDAASAEASTTVDAAKPPIDEICTNLAQEGSIVERTKKGGAAPAATGGTIAPGKYVLTAVNAYTTEPVFLVVRRAETVLVTSDRMDFAVVYEGDGTIQRSRSTYAIDANRIAWTFVCARPAPDGGPPSVPPVAFSATATELRIYAASGWGIDEAVYARQ